MTKLSTEAKPLEREMFVAREVLRLGVIRVLTMFPVDSPVRRALAEILVKTADEQFDYAAACDEYQTDPAFYNAVERIRCHLTDALLQRNKEQEEQVAVMRGAAKEIVRQVLLEEPTVDHLAAIAQTALIESATTPDTGKVVEKLPSLARVQEILKDVDGVHSSSQAFPADAIRRIGSLWGYAHELAEMVCALPVTWGQEEVTPDTGKRVVDVETKETIWKSK